MHYGLRYSLRAIVAALVATLAHAQHTQAQPPLPAPEVPRPEDAPSLPPISPLPVAPSPDFVTSRQDPFLEMETLQMRYPNRALLVTGATVFAGFYLPALIITASRDDDANNLYYPVVGPWLELTREPNDGVGKAVLSIDGVLQGVGALMMLSSLVVPERHTRDWYLIGNRRVQLAPQVAQRTVSVSARGVF